MDDVENRVFKYLAPPLIIGYLAAAMFICLALAADRTPTLIYFIKYMVYASTLPVVLLLIAKLNVAFFEKLSMKSNECDDEFHQATHGILNLYLAQFLTFIVLLGGGIVFVLVIEFLFSALT